MEVSFLPLELSSVEELQSSLKDLDESILTMDNKVYLHHGPNSIAIKKQKKHNAANGTVQHERTLVDLIQEEWRPFEAPFHPHPLLQTGQLQTIYAGARNFDDLVPIRYARKLLTMHDGGTIGLDIVLDSEQQYTKGLEIDDEIKKRKDYVKNLPPRIRYMQSTEESEFLQSDDDRPMLVCLHGLSGGSHESYVRALLNEIVKSGRWKACCLNSRGCGRTNITTQQLFCANWTEDIRTTMKFLKKQFPNRRFYAVGFSLGANILCNYLGEEGANSPFVAAASVSNPWQLQQASEHLQSTFIGRNLFSRHMGANLKKVFYRQYHMMKGHPKVNWTGLKNASFIYEFDAAVTAPIFGYASHQDYYNTASSTLALPKIKTPLFCVNALDDPIVPESVIPWDGIAANEYTILAYTHRGGHLGWFTWGKERWFVRAVGDFFELIEKTVCPE